MPLLALFVRGHVGVELTPAGGEFLQEAEELLSAAARLALFGQRSSAGSKPPELLLPAGLPTAVEVILHRQLRSLAPGLDLVVHHHPEPATGSGATTDLIGHFGKMPARGAFRTPGLMPPTLVPQASHGCVEANARPESLEELLQHPLLRGTQVPGDGRGWPLLGGGELEVARSVVSDCLSLIQQLTLDGAGVSRLPDDPRALAFEPELADLVPVLPDRQRARHDGRRGPPTSEVGLHRRLVPQGGDVSPLVRDVPVRRRLGRGGHSADPRGGHQPQHRPDGAQQGHQRIPKSPGLVHLPPSPEVRVVAIPPPLRPHPPSGPCPASPTLRSSKSAKRSTPQ